MTVCDNFINTPPNQYRPLACKPIIVTTQEIKGRRYANRLDLFFKNKSAQLQEHATLDLLYPTPLWYRNNLTPVAPTQEYSRITDAGEVRITDAGDTRVVNV